MMKICLNLVKLGSKYNDNPADVDPAMLIRELTNVPLAIKLMRLRMHWDIGTGSASDYVLNLIELLEGMGPAVKLRLSFDEVTDLWAVYNLLELAEENEMTEAFERLIAKCSFAEGEHTLSLLLHPINTPF